MTQEHFIVFGLDDIKALCFQCNHGCGGRLLVPPEKMDFDAIRRCPLCQREWLPDDAVEQTGRVAAATVSAFGAFLEGLKRLRMLANEGVTFGFTLLLQFEEPRS